MPLVRALALASGLISVCLLATGCGQPCRDVGLFTIRPDGSDRHRVKLDRSLFEGESDFSNYVAYATWMPDGKRIAFRDSCTWWTIKVDGSEPIWPPKNPTFRGRGVRLAWMQPTKKAENIAGFRIPPPVPGFTILSQGTPPRDVLFDSRLSYSSDTCIGDGAPYRPLDPSMSPRIAPDGRSVAYVDRYPSRGKFQRVQIFRVSRTGGPPRRLTAGKATNVSPRWSPDSSKIAYVNEANDTVHVMNSDGTRDRIVARRSENVAWSPDGRRLVVARGGLDGNQELDVVDLRGVVLRRLATGDLFSYSVSWAPGDRVVYVQDSGDDTQDKCGS